MEGSEETRKKKVWSLQTPLVDTKYMEGVWETDQAGQDKASSLEKGGRIRVRKSAVGHQKTNDTGKGQARTEGVVRESSIGRRNWIQRRVETIFCRDHHPGACGDSRSKRSCVNCLRM